MDMSKKFCVILTKVNLFALLPDLVGISTWNEMDSDSKGVLADHTRNYYSLYLTKVDDAQGQSKKFKRVDDGKEAIICSSYRVAKRHFTRQLNKIKQEMKLSSKNDWCLCLQVPKQGSENFTSAFGYTVGLSGKIQKVSMPLPEDLATKNDDAMGWVRY